MPIEVRSLAAWEAAGIPDMLSLIIPAHNEGGHISETMRQFVEALREAQIVYEIVVVNDNSSEGTERILARLSAETPSIRHVNNVPPNGFGTGGAVRTRQCPRRGRSHRHGRGVGRSADLVRFYRVLVDGSDCVLGSCFIRGGRVSDYPSIKSSLNFYGRGVLTASAKHDYARSGLHRSLCNPDAGGRFCLRCTIGPPAGIDDLRSLRDHEGQKRC
jgi:dolichol-phosphate mannosyltransferase